MKKQIAKIILAINTVYVKVFEPLREKRKGFYICERYDLKDKK